jgi:hypothetical protein
MAAARSSLETPPAGEVLWVILGSRANALGFATQYGFQPDQLGFIDHLKVEGSFRARELAIPATPLRVVLTDDRIVTSVALSNEALRPSELDAFCR